MSNSVGAEVDIALASGDNIPRERVHEWITAASDLSTLSKLYRLTNEGYYRIQPELGQDETCSLILTYLLGCVRDNIEDSDEIQSRFEAAQSLHVWFCHLNETGGTSAILTKAAHGIKELFLTSDDETRDAIETMFLEHALEMSALRPYFQDWSDHPVLQAAWKRATEWGIAHPGYTWAMLKQLQAQSE
ncbi:MAG TPA: hypothetical protein VFO34_05840 [Candidatus Acidoferrales bacterium]|nr:hypothetical protein [Candidatus Acidoferrales bacterium]